MNWDLSWSDMLSSFVYSPCLVAGLLGGFVTRRWYVAVVIAAVLAPSIDAVLNQMFSDAQPHFVLFDSVFFGVVAALEALLVWALRRAWRASRRRAAGG